MRAAPNIEMIAASLRSCSLGRTVGAGSPSVPTVEQEEEEEQQLSEVCDESSGGGGGGGGEVITVELNSEAGLPLPCNWEQRLELRTGKVYYINRETGKRSLQDPRTGADADGKDACSSDDSCSGVGGSSDDRESSVDSGSSNSSCISSLSAAASSPVETTVAEPRNCVCDRCQLILVAAGCRSCFMYFMVPKNVDACPKCGDGLLHLGRHGCS